MAGEEGGVGGEGQESLCRRLFHWAMSTAIGLEAACSSRPMADADWLATAAGAGAIDWAATAGGGRSQQEQQARFPLHAGQNDAPLLIRP